MELKGVLDTSLGNFLCIRGYARLGELNEVSDYDESFQRNLIDTHKKEVVDFLSDSQFLFFPEVILGIELVKGIELNEDVNQLYLDFSRGNNINYKAENFSLRCAVNKTKGATEARSFSYFRRATITIPDKVIKGENPRIFSRIDGNHRISAANEKPDFADINTPFCLILFRNDKEKDQFSRVLFHNINAKSIPVRLDHSTRLILEDSGSYPDNRLIESPSFGYEYYFARKIYKKLDFDLLPHIHQSFWSDQSESFEYASTFLTLFKFLLKKKVISDSDNTIRRFKNALSEINQIYGKDSSLKNCKNHGLLGAFLYFQLKPEHTAIVPSFFNWVTANHISEIEEMEPQGIVKVYEKIIGSKGRKIFVSMPFGKEITDNHFDIINRVCNELNQEKNLKIKIKAERVDWFEDGTSYDINDKILSMISNCGMLIGNLTYARPNVYHEIGFIMGRDKAMGKINNNFILILDETVSDEKDKLVGFNLKSIKQIRFTQTEQLAAKLRENIMKFYGLKSNPE